MVQKYVHPTQDRQQAEMDRFDAIRQEGKRQYADSLPFQVHARPTATGNPGDLHRSGGKSCNEGE